MKKEQKKSSGTNLLRQKAEAQLKEKFLMVSRSIIDSDVLKIFHELQVYQVELEMQNEELRLANARTEQANLMMMEHLSTGVIIHGPDTKIRYANNQACLLLGLALDQMMGKKAIDTIWCFVHEDEKPLLRDEYPVSLVLATKAKLQNMEIGIKQPGTNDFVWVLVNAFPEFEPEGNMSHIVVTFVDISERKISEMKLKESEAQFKEFFESAADAIFIAEADTGKILDANQAASRLLLLPHDKIIGLHQSQLHPFKNSKFSQDTFNFHHHESKETFHVHPVENKVLRSDGTEVPVEIMAASINIKDRQCLMGTFRDITERRLAEEALMENNSMLELAMNSANMAWWEMDILTGFVTFDKRKTDMMGYPFEMFKHYSDFVVLLHAEDLERTMDAMKRLLNGLSDKYETEYRILTKSGEYKWFYDIGTIVKKDINGSPLKIAGLVIDITERKLAEREKFKLLDIIEKSLNEIYVFDSTTLKFEYANQGALQNLGYTQSEIKCLTPIDIKTEKTELEFGKLIQPLLNNEKESICFETIHRRKNASFYPVEVHLQLHQQDEKSLFFAVVNDITERKKAKETLIRLNQAIENSKEVVFMTDKEGVFTFVNSQFTEIYGYTAEEVVGKKTPRILKSDYYKKGDIEVFWDALLNKQNLLSMQYVNKCRDGGLIDMEASANPILDEQGEIIGFLAIQREITERKRAENKIKTLGRAIEQGPSSIVITNAEGKIEFVNHKFTELTQYQLEDVRGKLPRIFNPHHLPDKEFEALWKSLKKGKTWKGELQNRRKDRSVFWEEVTISAVKNPDRTISNYILIKNDITEKKQMLDDLIAAKEKAEESDHLKSAFLANMSHEIRTPMNGILGFSDLLKDKLANTEHFEMIDSIHKSGKRLMATLNAIIDLSMLESTSIKVAYEFLDPIGSIYEVMAIYKKFAASKNLSLDVIVKDDRIRVKADESLFQQVISALIDNALKFTKEGGVRIELDSRLKDGLHYFVCSIKDSGIGIPKAKQGLILQRFRQGSEGMGREFEGNGLGLTLAGKMLALMDGKIVFESEEGIGSVFTIEFPGEIS